MEQEQIFNVVAKAKSGDQEAFTDLYNNAYKMVYLTCLGHMKNPEEAEDCAQETFITIYNKLDSLEDNNTFFGWAKTIAVRVCLHKLRSTHNNISYDDAIESGVNIEGDDNLEDLPDSMIMEEAKRNIILDILKKELKEVQYQTIFMFYYDNMPVEKIAEVMECPVGTVKTRLKAARVKIKEGIESYEKKTGDKLCAAGTFPALGALFTSTLEGTSVTVPPLAIGTAVGIAGKAGAAKAVTMGSKATKIAKAGAAVGKKALATKIIAGVAATAVIGGSAIGISKLLRKPVNLEIGNVITFGIYDGEPLEWVILDEQDGSYLIQARSTNEGHSIFHSFMDEWNDEDDWASTVNWENSDLRTWLNGDFYEEAFTPAQRRIIEASAPGSDAEDTIYLLTLEELDSYYDEYNTEVGYPLDDYGNILMDGYIYGWAPDGSVIELYNNGFITSRIGQWDNWVRCDVRPVMWVNLDELSSSISNGNPDRPVFVYDNSNVVATNDYSIGSLISMGHDGFGTPINWRVLDELDGRYLVVSDMCVAAMPLDDTNFDEDGTPHSTSWEQCPVRSWLNNDFYNMTFDDSERSRIELTLVDNDGSSSTNDYLFLLSESEVRQYFSSDSDRECMIALNSVLRVEEGLTWLCQYHSHSGDSAEWWWLRNINSRSINSWAAPIVGWDGSLEEESGELIWFDTNTNCMGVRPAMWITAE